jgi:hypothetical protein
MISDRGPEAEAPTSCSSTSSSIGPIIGEELTATVLVAEALNSSTPQAKVGCSRIFDGHFARARPEADKDRNLADNDFDLIIKQMWMQHLSTLSEEIAVKKSWKSGYWHRWYEDLDMNAIVDEEMFVAVLEDEYCDQDDGFNWIAEIDPSDSGDETFILYPDASESGMESHPITEDDRRVEPALQNDHTQGGSTESKLPDELSACNARPRMPTVPE